PRACSCGPPPRTSLAHPARRISLRQYRQGRARVHGVGEELPRHRPAAEAGGREPTDDPAIVPAGEAADQGPTVAREGHEPGPGARDRQVSEERQSARGMGVIDLDATGLGRGVLAHALAVAAEDDLAVPALAPIEVTREAAAVAHGEVRRID